MSRIDDRRPIINISAPQLSIKNLIDGSMIDALNCPLMHVGPCSFFNSRQSELL